MTGTTTLCFMCGAVVKDGTRLCKRDRATLMEQVREANDLLRELDVTISRQAKTAPTIGRKSPHTPMAFHVGASNAADELRASIRDMARATTTVTDTQVRRFQAARTDAFRAIDIASGRMFCGECPCDARTPLYAQPGADEVECRHCRAVWPAEEPDTWAYLEQAVGQLGEVRNWMLALGHQRSKPQLTRYIREQGVTPVFTAANGTPHYRLTDVLAAYYFAMAKRSAA